MKKLLFLICTFFIVSTHTICKRPIGSYSASCGNCEVKLLSDKKTCSLTCICNAPYTPATATEIGEQKNESTINYLMKNQTEIRVANDNGVLKIE